MKPDLKQTVLAYRCPHCGKNIFSVVGIFALSGDLMKLRCDCEDSELTLRRTSEGKIQLSVPCFLCPTPHTYTLSPHLTTERELFTLSCPYGGMSLCFFGQQKAVEEAVAAADRSLSDWMEEQKIPDFAAFSTLREYDCGSENAGREDLLRFTVADLAEEGKIYCRCPEGEGDYTVDSLTDSALVYCRKCGATRMFPMWGTVSENAFLHLNQIDLRDTTEA